VIARPTVHEGLFIQMVGRILRPHAGKTDAVILDPTGVLFRHSLNGVIDLSSSERPEADDELEDDLTEDELDELPEVDPDAGIRARVTGYEDVELIRVGGTAGPPWLVTAGGIPFSQLRADEVVFVIGPDRHEYPWFSVGVIGRTPRWLATQLTESEAMAMLPDQNMIPPFVDWRNPESQVALASRLLDGVQSWT
jgi:hypothetical protein